jgi:hypothetical protein
MAVPLFRRNLTRRDSARSRERLRARACRQIMDPQARSDFTEDRNAALREERFGVSRNNPMQTDDRHHSDRGSQRGCPADKQFNKHENPQRDPPESRTS